MKDTNSRALRVWAMVAIAAVGTATFLLLPPMPQPQAYHHFADDRTMLGIPNFLNVMSNAPFAVLGAMGLRFVWRRRMPNPGPSFIEGSERTPFAVFFVGTLLTCFGSGYYHWEPNDATLTWDRLPMTLAFMGLLAAVVAERIDTRAGRCLLWPLVIAGAASVWWWRRSGNLWPYVCAQFFSIVLIVLLLVLFPPRYNRTGDLLWVMGFYALAKAFEALDWQVYHLTNRIVSGHTLKHLVAALAVYWVLRMLQRRSPVNRFRQPC